MEFKKGDSIPLLGGKSAKIISTLGEGGQGIVYSVEIDESTYALKWYTCRFENKKKFRENLQENIKRGSPDKRFLWPLFLTEEQNDNFGYVMNLRPKEYSDFSDFLNNKVDFPDTKTLILTALNLVNSFRKLHQEGLAYQDLNDGNFFINTQTGDILVCDNDNVTPGGIKNPGNVGGKPGYMAPEVFRGDKFPGVLSDNYSLAVILFKLFCLHDPLMGKAYVESICITEKREMELYGTHPVFIFNPSDDSNRPVKEIHGNPLKIWPRLPQYIRDAFIKSFVDGIKNPNVRLPDNEWQKKLLRFLDETLVCPICGSEHMIYNFSEGQQMNFTCKHTFSYPRWLHVKDYKVPLFPGNKIRACHINEASDDYAKIEGEVIMNKNNNSLWGIKNLSELTWTFSLPDGQLKTVERNSVVPIAKNMEINFGNTTGKIVN